VDTLYANAIARTGIDPTTIRVVHLSASQPFRSATDLAQTFEVRERAVVPRRAGRRLSRAQQLRRRVGTYLEHGGHFFLSR
jgi:hypothetical protein